MERFAFKRSVKVFQIRWEGTQRCFDCIKDWVPCSSLQMTQSSYLKIKTGVKSQVIEIKPGATFSIVKCDKGATVSTTVAYFVNRLAATFGKTAINPWVFAIKIPESGYVFDGFKIQADTLEKEIADAGLKYNPSTNALVIGDRDRFYLVEHDYLIRTPGVVPFYLSLPSWFIREYCIRTLNPIRGYASRLDALDLAFVSVDQSIESGIFIPVQCGVAYLTKNTFQRCYIAMTADGHKGKGLGDYYLDVRRFQCQGIQGLKDFEVVEELLKSQRVNVQIEEVNKTTRRYTYPSGSYAEVSVGGGIAFNKQVMFPVTLEELTDKLQIPKRRTAIDARWEELNQIDIEKNKQMFRDELIARREKRVQEARENSRNAPKATKLLIDENGRRYHLLPDGTLEFVTVPKTPAESEDSDCIMVTESHIRDNLRKKKYKKGTSLEGKFKVWDDKKSQKDSKEKSVAPENVEVESEEIAVESEEGIAAMFEDAANAAAQSEAEAARLEEAEAAEAVGVIEEVVAEEVVAEEVVDEEVVDETDKVEEQIAKTESDNSDSGIAIDLVIDSNDDEPIE